MWKSGLDLRDIAQKVLKHIYLNKSSNIVLPKRTIFLQKMTAEDNILSHLACIDITRSYKMD